MNILVAVTIFLFILGSWSHRMIGAETLSTFLFVFFTLSLEWVGTELNFSPLGQLRYLANYGDIFPEGSGTYSKIVDMLHLRVLFIENNLMIGFVLLVGLLGLAGAALYYQLKSPKKSPKPWNFTGQHPFLHLFYIVLLPVSFGYLIYILITSLLPVIGFQA